MLIGTFCRLSDRLVAVTMMSPGCKTAGALVSAAAICCCASAGVAASSEEEPSSTGIIERSALRRRDVTPVIIKFAPLDHHCGHSPVTISWQEAPFLQR